MAAVFNRLSVFIQHRCIRLVVAIIGTRPVSSRVIPAGMRACPRAACVLNFVSSSCNASCLSEFRLRSIELLAGWPVCRSLATGAAPRRDDAAAADATTVVAEHRAAERTNGWIDRRSDGSMDGWMDSSASVRVGTVSAVDSSTL